MASPALPAAVPPPSGVAVPQYPERFIALVKKLEVDQQTAFDLYSVLSSCDIVLLCDDSGSMLSTVAPEPGAPPQSTPVTRWDQLKRFAATLIDFVTSINPEGLSITFLNRQGLSRVTALAGLQPLFADQPNNGTPLGGALQRLFQAGQHLRAQGRHQLIVVATDGEPSDCSSQDLYRIIAGGINQYVHVSAVEFTDNEETMAYMDGWNSSLATFDNTDDWAVDLRKVRNLRGPNYRVHTCTHRGEGGGRPAAALDARCAHLRSCPLSAMSVRLQPVGDEDPAGLVPAEVQADRHGRGVLHAAVIARPGVAVRSPAALTSPPASSAIASCRSLYLSSVAASSSSPAADLPSAWVHRVDCVRSAALNPAVSSGPQAVEGGTHTGCMSWRVRPAAGGAWPRGCVGAGSGSAGTSAGTWEAKGEGSRGDEGTRSASLLWPADDDINA